jgi:hypothetical protein
MLSSSISSSTDNLLNLFPMFGHPGISALEYAGQVDALREQNQRLSEVSHKRKSSTSTQDKNATAATTPGEEELVELSPPLHFIDEFGCQQRRRGTFLNHTPRNYELRSSQPPVEVYRPSTRAESENYSRPLSRQSSMASGSPALTSHHGHSMSTNSSSFGQRSTLDHETVAELDTTEVGVTSSPEVYRPSTKSHRRSLSAPHGKVLTYQPGAATSTNQPCRDPSLRSTSLPEHQPQEKKRQRRQTPFKLITTKQINVPRHSPMEPWVAEHRRKGTTETIETIGDVPVDMNRELSAEFGTFGVIQRYFDSQGGGPVSAADINSDHQPSKLPVTPPPACDVPLPRTPTRPIDELRLPDDPPPLPDRSPKRMTNPAFPLSPRTLRVRDSDFNIAAEGHYSPYDTDNENLHVAKKRTKEERPDVGQVPWIGSPTVGRLAPPILGHDAITASSELCLNDLAHWLRHTAPKTETQKLTKEQKKKGMKLFKVKQRKSLAARVGSVEGSPQRARNRPAIPSCTKEMTTAGGARHLRIIIPTESPPGSQAVTLPLNRRRSRHISISFTEEMLNPLASPEVERMISTFEMPERSVSAPIPRSPRSPKRPPRSPKPIPVDDRDHPLAVSPSRDELTRARKLRDLQRIKRKPLPDQTSLKSSKSLPNQTSLESSRSLKSTKSLKEQQADPSTTGALPTPAHTPEPTVPGSSEDGDEGMTVDSPEQKVERMQDQMLYLKRQNTQLAEALATIVGLQLNDGDLKSEEVLKAFRQIRDSRVLSVSSKESRVLSVSSN